MKTQKEVGIPHNFEFIKTRAEELYKSFAPVRCPYFNALVHFNAQGLKHLKFKGDAVERVAQDQYMRYKLLHLAPLILKRSGTIQAISCRQGFEYVRRNNKTELIAVQRIYHEFIAVIDDVRVRVIVKQVNSGELCFWSIIPYWKSDGKNRLLGFGNPEAD